MSRISRKTRIVCLPLDDRPCNYEQVAELGRIADITVELPPLTLVQRATQTYGETRSWLETALRAPDCVAACISVDGWIYGGLVQSRTLQTPTEVALSRLEDLRELIESRPEIPFYLSSVLLRLSVTLGGAQSQEDWRLVFDYSVQADRAAQAERQNLPSAPAESLRLEEIRRKIPHPLLEEYLGARRRAFEINSRLITLTPKIQGLLLGQEDCAEFGLHREEKLRLQELIERLPPPEHARRQIMTGADELMAMNLLQAAMHLFDVRAQSVPLMIRLTSEAQATSIPLDGQDGPEIPEVMDAPLERVSLYEDISISRNLALHMAVTPFFPLSSSLGNLRNTAKAGNASDLRQTGAPVLWIHPFAQSGQKDLCLAPAPSSSDSAPETRAGASAMSSLRPGDALLDLTYANGADPELMKDLLQKLPLTELGAFSAWNTTGNRIGTLLAQLGLQVVAKKRAETGSPTDPQADRDYTFVRLADDLLYQSEVRQELEALCRAQGQDPWNLSPDAWKQYSLECDRRMQAAIQRWRLNPKSAQAPDNTERGGEKPLIRCSLPWPRLFEARIERYTPSHAH